MLRRELQSLTDVTESTYYLRYIIEQQFITEPLLSRVNAHLATCHDDVAKYKNAKSQLQEYALLIEQAYVSLHQQYAGAEDLSSWSQQRGNWSAELEDLQRCQDSAYQLYHHQLLKADGKTLGDPLTVKDFPRLFNPLLDIASPLIQLGQTVTRPGKEVFRGLDPGIIEYFYRSFLVERINRFFGSLNENQENANLIGTRSTFFSHDFKWQSGQEEKLFQARLVGKDSEVNKIAFNEYISALLHIIGSVNMSYSERALQQELLSLIKSLRKAPMSEYQTILTFIGASASRFLLTRANIYGQFNEVYNKLNAKTSEIIYSFEKNRADDSTARQAERTLEKQRSAKGRKLIEAKPASLLPRPPKRQIIPATTEGSLLVKLKHKWRTLVDMAKKDGAIIPVITQQSLDTRSSKNFTRANGWFTRHFTYADKRFDTIMCTQKIIRSQQKQKLTLRQLVNTQQKYPLYYDTEVKNILADISSDIIAKNRVIDRLYHRLAKEELKLGIIRRLQFEVIMLDAMEYSYLTLIRRGDKDILQIDVSKIQWQKNKPDFRAGKLAAKVGITRQSEYILTVQEANITLSFIHESLAKRPSLLTRDLVASMSEIKAYATTDVTPTPAPRVRTYTTNFKVDEKLLNPQQGHKKYIDKLLEEINIDKSYKDNAILHFFWRYRSNARQDKESAYRALQAKNTAGELTLRAIDKVLSDHPQVGVASCMRSSNMLKIIHTVQQNIRVQHPIAAWCYDQWKTQELAVKEGEICRLTQVQRGSFIRCLLDAIDNNWLCFSDLTLRIDINKVDMGKISDNFSLLKHFGINHINDYKIAVTAANQLLAAILSLDKYDEKIVPRCVTPEIFQQINHLHNLVCTSSAMVSSEQHFKTT